MSEFTSMFENGMETVESFVGEPFSYNGATYIGIFNSANFEVQLVNGGFESKRGSILVVRKVNFNWIAPATGEYITKLPYEMDQTTTNYRVESVANELSTYTIVLVDTNR